MKGRHHQTGIYNARRSPAWPCSGFAFPRHFRRRLIFLPVGVVVRGCSPRRPKDGSGADASEPANKPPSAAWPSRTATHTAADPHASTLGQGGAALAPRSGGSLCRLSHFDRHPFTSPLTPPARRTASHLSAPLLPSLAMPSKSNKKQPSSSTDESAIDDPVPSYETALHRAQAEATSPPPPPLPAHPRPPPHPRLPAAPPPPGHATHLLPAPASTERRGPRAGPRFCKALLYAFLIYILAGLITGAITDAAVREGNRRHRHPHQHDGDTPPYHRDPWDGSDGRGWSVEPMSIRADAQ
ncbi:uncharacterized protein PSFLO_03828 [Pseudozyma flocculosa]|uniref:Uncharacterized protein n=1 Tax=Pseudozyma flocculosa TaxID=84751 RepID=A0A5C3F545_9BASI|nr:uncharacterized protein PSFLO_03828 [Pseudozyma flocculosa]